MLLKDSILYYILLILKLTFFIITYPILFLVMLFEIVLYLITFYYLELKLTEQLTGFCVWVVGKIIKKQVSILTKNIKS